MIDSNTINWVHRSNGSKEVGNGNSFLNVPFLDHNTSRRPGTSFEDDTLHRKEIFAESSVTSTIGESKRACEVLCLLDRASSWYLNKGWPTRWHLLYYLLLNMFQTLIRPSSGACDYLLRCVGWLKACWCYVAGLSFGDVVSECRLNQPALGYHITNRQSRYITPARLKSVYTTQQVVASSWRWTY